MNDEGKGFVTILNAFSAGVMWQSRLFENAELYVSGCCCVGAECGREMPSLYELITIPYNTIKIDNDDVLKNLFTTQR